MFYRILKQSLLKITYLMKTKYSELKSIDLIRNQCIWFESNIQMGNLCQNTQINKSFIMQEEKPQIDHNALSRQLAVYGAEAQGKLMAMRVFIHGLTGLAVQVAKNLILAGPKQVTLFDEAVVTIADVGRNFYCNEGQVGKTTRAEACLTQLKELNPVCTVNVSKDASIQFISKNFDCVVVLDNYSRQYLVNLNKACRQNRVGFILAGNLGLYGYTFVDFGQAHKVFDLTGQQPKMIHIAGITKQQKAIVYLHEEKRHGLNDGDTVQFKQVKGMTQINGQKFKVQVKTPGSFHIGNTSAFSAYQNGGIAIQTKIPVQMKFHDLEKSLRYPYPPDSMQMPIASWDKFGVPEQLHIVINGVYDFYAKHNRLPQILNEIEAHELVQLVNQHKSKKMEIEGQNFNVESVDQNLIKNVARYAQTQISPTCSFWGGIITQEIVKLTGKYTPLRQWLHHQFFQVLPTQNVPKTVNAANRYNDYIVLFGDEFVHKCQGSSSFVIGAGALGCQFIKMFALMGASTTGKGKVFVTDDDNIEISNLNRQFLFRKPHVGQNKSQTACSVGRRMNPQSKFECIKLRVGQENQQYFNDDFWTGLNFVVNAVDNVKARQYVDQQCVWYEKPLFQSGTLGTKCHSQIIIPHHTLSYTDIIDPPEESIPLCTLKNFPYQIQHTIQWARDYFEGLFSEPSSELQKFYSDHNQTITELQKQHKQNPSTLRGKLQTLNKLYRANEEKSYQTCVQLAVDIFQDSFNNQIAQLLNAFPADHIIEDTGKPFWSGLKRAPQVLQFSVDDPIHLELVQSGANIFATMFNIPVQKDKLTVAKIASKASRKPFLAKKIKIETEEKKQKSNEPVQIDADDEQQCKNLSEFLRSLNVDKSRTSNPIEFEKDDPTNWHIEFMSGVSNLRARNYKIQEVDNFKVKLIAGKIIPAIATTTAMVVGAVGMQIIKFLLNKPASVYKNVTINLALPLWVFNDPLEPIMNQDKEFDPIMCGPIKVIPGKFTKWDKINLKGPMTLEAMKKHFQQKYNIEVSMITFGSATVFSSYGADSKKRLPLLVEQGIAQVTKKEFPKWKRFIPIGISGNTHDGTDCLLPDIRYQIA